MNKRAAACIAAVAILGAISILALRENSSIDEYQNEIVALSEAIKKGDHELVESLLNRKISSGRYGKAEEAAKNYFRDLIAVTDDMRELRDSDDLYLLLDSKNLENDDEELSASKRKAQKLRSQADEIIAKYNQINDNSAHDYLNGDDEETAGLFKTAIEEIVENDADAKNYQNTKYIVSSTIDIYSEALDYLSTHRDSWTIKNNTIEFTNSDAQKDYQKILDKVSSAGKDESSSAQ